MLSLALPTGKFHGWGVCSENLIREISALTEVKIFNPEHQQDPEVRRCLEGYQVRVDGPVLQACQGANLLPLFPNLKGSRNVLYCFIEDNLTVRRAAPKLGEEELADHYVAGSNWCEQALRDAGLTNVSTIPQGVDTTQFHPLPRTRDLDKFVIFSGGKFEYRKGHDIVIKAVATMMERHPGVYLLPLWFNPWPFTMQTMAESRLIRLPAWWPGDMAKEPRWFHEVLMRNGIPLDRVIPCTQTPNGIRVAEMMCQTDVGLFPNRAEGGTNLVAQEMIACGKPAILSANTGHLDVIKALGRPGDVPGLLPIEKQSPINFQGRGEWQEPDLEETIFLLECAYAQANHYARIAEDQAHRVAAAFSWRTAARQFLEVLGIEHAG